ncbi:MAG: DUF2800 domain-containing protein [Longicatena sp.]|uniref:DUF2800 domain-containing protein n=2 Tax=Anaerorhabdus sp. TaxID=1872524 RepID=UPI002FC6CF4F
MSHAEREHALLSASASHRWLECTPSAVLEDGLADKDSAYSLEGTRAHEIAEECLRAWQNGEDFKNYEADDWRIYNEVLAYIHHVQNAFNELKSINADAVIFFESKVDYSKYVPEGFGTCDTVILAGNTLFIKDLKFGKGVEVYAENNSQLQLYALGAIEKFGDLYDFENVHMEICQPRKYHFDSSVMKVEELVTWGIEFVKPRALLAFEGKGEFKTGTHCQFCKAAGACRFQAEENMKLMMHEFKDPQLLSDEEVAEIIEHADQLSGWAKAVKDYATKQLLEGKELPGWKVVEGRANRAYTNEDEVATALIKAGYEEPLLYDRKLLGITAMEKVVGEKKFGDLLKDLIIKPQGKPTLAKEDDKRPAITNADMAFSGVEVEEE